MKHMIHASLFCLILLFTACHREIIADQALAEYVEFLDSQDKVESKTVEERRRIADVKQTLLAESYRAKKQVQYSKKDNKYHLTLMYIPKDANDPDQCKTIHYTPKKFSPIVFSKRFLGFVEYSLRNEFYEIDDRKCYEPLFGVMAKNFARAYRREVNRSGSRLEDDRLIDNGFADPGEDELFDVTRRGVQRGFVELLKRAYERTRQTMTPWDNYADAFQVENLLLVGVVGGGVFIASATDNFRVSFSTGLGFLIDVKNYLASFFEDVSKIRAVNDNKMNLIAEKAAFMKTYNALDQYRLKVRLRNPLRDDAEFRVSLYRRFDNDAKIGMSFQYNLDPDEDDGELRSVNQIEDASEWVLYFIEFEMPF